MTDTTTAFFRGLHGHEPALTDITAAIRFDVADDTGSRSWRLTIDHGDLGVSPDTADADCVMAATEAVFGALAGGRTNAMAAVLRGEVAVSGDPELLVAVQRLFPGSRQPTGGQLK
jgi:hypothetical protein